MATTPEFAWGYVEIGEAIGRNHRQVQHLVAVGLLPVTRIGNVWVGHVPALRRALGVEDQVATRIPEAVA